MSISTNNVTHTQVDGALLEKIIINQDVASLQTFEKILYIKMICNSIGLNPLTKPIQIIKFQGKEVLYMTKDATEQLRKNNKVSITNIDSKILNDNIYVVTAIAKTPDGREDSSTGVISIKGMIGDALSNAMMKAETKAKRRVTLSICGLGFMDESEIDSIPNAKPVDIYLDNKDQSKIEAIDINKNISSAVQEIEKCSSLEMLQDVYKSHYKKFVTERNNEAIVKITLAKDNRKEELILDDFGNDIIEGEKNDQLL